MQNNIVRDVTFNDWFSELRELAGDDVATEAPTAFAIWSGGGTPAQALFMIHTILPARAAA